MDQSQKDSSLIIKKAMDTAIRFIQYRPRSTNEVKQKLLLKGYNGDLVQTIITALTESLILNDAVYARLFAVERAQSKNLGKSRVKMELKQKGIADDLIAEAMAEAFPEGTEAVGAMNLLEKKYKTGISKEGEQKAIEYLIRKGYGFGEAKKAVKVAF